MTELGLSDYLVSKYSAKETQSQYRNIDNKGLMKELCSKIKDERISVTEQIKAEVEYLGYAEYTNKDISDSYYIVINYNDDKNATRPYCTLYRICDGKK